MPMRLRIVMLLSTTWPLAKPPRSMRTPSRAKRTVRALASSTRCCQPTAWRARCKRGRVGRDALPVVVQVPDAGIRDVERAVGQPRELERALDQAEHLGAHRHAGVGRFAVDARQFRIGLERAHQAVDAVHLRHHRVDRPLGHLRIVAPQLDVDRGAHDGLVATEPLAALSHGHGRRQAGRPAGARERSVGTVNRMARARS